MSDAGLLGRLAGVPGSTRAEERLDGLWMEAPAIDVQALARLMGELGFRLSTMTALAGPGLESTVIYHYCSPNAALNVKTATRGASLPSIAPIARSADWIEREIHELYKVDFPGHPGLSRLVLPRELEEGLYRGPGGSAGAAAAGPEGR